MIKKLKNTSFEIKTVQYITHEKKKEKYYSKYKYEKMRVKIRYVKMSKNIFFLKFVK